MTGNPSLFGRLFDRFKSTPPAVPPEQGWSGDSLLYSRSDIPKYNPDELIGRKGYGVYRKMMTDEQVKAVVRFKRDAITGRDWHFECEHEGLSEEERERRVKIFERVVAKLEGSFTDAMNGVMSAMYNGFSLTEKVLGHVEHDGLTWIGVEKLRLRPFDTFFFYTDAYGNVEKLEQKWQGRSQTIDLRRFVHYVQNPDYDELYGQSELREAYRSWWSKDAIIKFWNIYLERSASGFVWVTPTTGKTLVSGSTEYTALQSVLNNITSKTSIILPSGYELHVEKPGTTTAYQDALSFHDKAIAKALLVPNLLGISEQGQTGSYSQSQTQFKAFFWTLKNDGNRLEETLNEQLFRELGDLNWGDGLYPRFKFKSFSREELLETIKTWADMVKAGSVIASDTDEAYIRELLDVPERGEPIKAAPVVDPVKEPGQDDDQKTKQPLPDDDEGGQTIAGRQTARVSSMCQDHDHGPRMSSKASFSKAMRRVDFAVIGSKSDDSAEDAAYDLAALVGDAVARMMSDAEALKLGTAAGDPAKVAGLTFSSAELAGMKKAAIRGLRSGWAIGRQHASKEIRKASKERFTRQYFEVQDRALTDIAGKFFEARGHQITGSISQQAQTTIQGVLMEGIKSSKAFADVKKEIYKALEAEGLLTDEDVIEALGTKTVKNTKARIQTIMRTSTFEAINEARYETFSDPGLDGFVEALEYSAIMDDRTTEVCSRLDGKVYPLKAEEWQTFSPPNHYNCRSLLIPVTQADEWTAAEAPTINPQKGFGFERIEPPEPMSFMERAFAALFSGRFSQPAETRIKLENGITADEVRGVVKEELEQMQITVNVPPSEVTVQNSISVQPADVLPVFQAGEVVVNVPAPEVTVQNAVSMPDRLSMDITSMPVRRKSADVEYDGQGNVKSSTQIERDA